MHTEHMPTNIGPSNIVTYKRAFKILEAHGFKPLLQRFDIDAYHVLQVYMSEPNIDCQLTPSHIHCRNAAERAIMTFKNHFIAGISSTNTNLPLNLW
jgi:hypothetical protein